MSSTPILHIPMVATNQVNKEVTINDAIEALENATQRGLVVSMSGDTTLNLADFVGNFIFVCTGNSAPSTLSVPVSQRMFAVKNGNTASLTIKSGIGSTTASIGSGSVGVFLSDASNNCIKIVDSSVSAAATDFLGLSDVPGNYSSASLKLVRVNAGESGLEFRAPTLTDAAQFGTPVDTYFPHWDAGTGKLVWTPTGGGPGASNFTDLGDVPHAYTSKAGFFVKVNGGATGLDFVDPTGLFSFLSLTDAPASYAGSSNKVLAGNLTEDGLAFINLPSLGTIISITTGDSNAGFEGATISPWTTTIGSSAFNSVVSTDSGLTAYAGGKFLLSAGAATQTQLKRAWNLTLLATNFQLDNDLRIDLPYAFANHGGSTTGQITVECIDSVGALIHSYSSATLSGTVNTWVTGTFSVDAPPATRSINIKITSNSATAVSAGWDQLDPVLRVIKNPSFITMSDGPTSYTSQAKKVLRVNAGETGVEFHAPAFTDNSDTPTAYAGQALKLVRVNLAENALEFWTLNKGDMPGNLQSAASGAITLNRNNGEVHRLNVTGAVTSMTITNWAANGTLGKVTLEVVNTSSFSVAWPSGVKWAGGSAPAVTPNGRDIYVFNSFDNGTTVYGNVVGQGYA